MANLYKTTKRRARKRYRCAFCSLAIRAEDNYVEVIKSFEGRVGRRRAHLGCEAAMCTVWSVLAGDVEEEEMPVTVVEAEMYEGITDSALAAVADEREAVGTRWRLAKEEQDDSGPVYPDGKRFTEVENEEPFAAWRKRMHRRTALLEELYEQDRRRGGKDE